MTWIISRLGGDTPGANLPERSHAGLEQKPGSGTGASLLLTLMAGAILIFALLYSASHIALLSLPKQEGLEITSQLAADYSVWDNLEFEPVDPAIIEELQLERNLPGPLIVADPDWATPVPSFPLSPTTPAVESSAPQATADQPSIDPTNTPPAVTLTPAPTDADLQPQSTESPPVSQPRPTKTRKPHKTPKPAKLESMRGRE
jgi:hypothetical protein